MTDVISKILKDNFKFLLQLTITLFALWIFIQFMNPDVKLSDEDSNNIKKIDSRIDSLINEQNDIDENISKFNNQIFTIQDSILKLKEQRTIIQNVYDEKDIIISNFTDIELDSFFSERYGYSQNDVISIAGGKTNRK